MFGAVVGGSVVPAMPDGVEPGGEFRRQGISGILQASLLAARPTRCRASRAITQCHPRCVGDPSTITDTGSARVSEGNP
jgi:hypothetical protein